MGQQDLSRIKEGAFLSSSSFKEKQTRVGAPHDDSVAAGLRQIHVILSPCESS